MSESVWIALLTHLPDILIALGTLLSVFLVHRNGRKTDHLTKAINGNLEAERAATLAATDLAARVAAERATDLQTRLDAALGTKPAAGTTGGGACSDGGCR